MDPLNDALNQGLSDEELREHMLKRRLEIMTFARMPENVIDVTAGDLPGKHGDRCRQTWKLPEWETSITFTFTRERIAGRMPGTTRLVDHLSLGFSIPSNLTKGSVNAGQDVILNFVAPLVTDWFGATDVHAQVSPQEPIPVANPLTKQVVYRTPIHCHFVLPVSEDGTVDRRGL